MKRWRILTHRQNHLVWIANSCLQKDLGNQRRSFDIAAGAHKETSPTSLFLSTVPAHRLHPSPPPHHCPRHSGLGCPSFPSSHTHPVHLVHPTSRHPTSSTKSLSSMAITKFIPFEFLTHIMSLKPCSNAGMYVKLAPILTMKENQIVQLIVLPKVTQGWPIQTMPFAFQFAFRR